MLFKFHRPFTFCLTGPNVLLSTLFPNALNLCSSLRATNPIHTKQQELYSAVYFNL